MKREELKGMELEDEKIDAIMKMHGKDVEQQKQEILAATTKAAQLETQLADAAKAIGEFEKLDVEGVKAAAAEWQTKAEAAREDAEKQVQGLKFEFALSEALRGAKARNPKAVRALLDAEKLELTKNGTLDGLSEQLEAIKAENDYLFDSDNPAPRIISGGKPKDSTISDPLVAAFMEGAGLSLDK